MPGNVLKACRECPGEGRGVIRFKATSVNAAEKWIVFRHLDILVSGSGHLPIITYFRRVHQNEVLCGKRKRVKKFDVFASFFDRDRDELISLRAGNLVGNFK